MPTIYALSSGRPPAGIAVIRVSGASSRAVIETLAGSLPDPRKALLRTLRDGEGEVLDHAVVLWFPGPNTATGEDLAEFHLHGGRAVIASVEAAISAIPDCMPAAPGEFTRRAFANGRMDLAEAEGLGDLLLAETELQRRSAMAMAGGAFSAQVEDWRENVLRLSAMVEASLDFSDEDDVSGLPDRFTEAVANLGDDLDDWLLRPKATALREGFRVVLAGPPNAGKSTLFNAILDDEAAIVAPTAGTTRDVLERSVALGGVPFTFVDTAGLRDIGDDAIEQVGIERARAQTQGADLVLWLGAEGEGPACAWEIEAKIDQSEHPMKKAPFVRLSVKSGQGMDDLRTSLIAHARAAMPAPGAIALNDRQHALIAEGRAALREIAHTEDPLLIGEQLRIARLAFDRLIGRTSTEDMLDTLFGRFCIGK